MRMHKTCLPYMIIVAVVMSIYSIFLVHLTQSFGPSSGGEKYSGGQDPWNYYPRPAAPPPCQCTPESLAGLGARREVVVGLSFPYKHFNSNHWFHISEYYVSRHTHVAPKLPTNATVYIVAPHEFFVANLIPMTFFLLLLAFTDGTARTAEVLPRRALAQLAVTGDVLALDNMGVESYVYDRSLPAFHRTRKYQPGERQAGQQRPRLLAAVLESGGAGGEEGVRIPTIGEGAAAAAAAAGPVAGLPRKNAVADVERGTSITGVERHRRRQLQGTALPAGGPDAAEASGATSTDSHLRASASSGKGAWRASSSAFGSRRQDGGDGRAGASGDSEGWSDKERSDKGRGQGEGAGAALVAMDADSVGEGGGNASGGGGGGGAPRVEGSDITPEALEPGMADAPAVPGVVAHEHPGDASSPSGDATRSRGGGGGMNLGGDFERLGPREESSAGAEASAASASAAGKAAKPSLDPTRALAEVRRDNTDPAAQAIPALLLPPLPREAVEARSAAAGGGGALEGSRGAKGKERGQERDVEAEGGHGDGEEEEEEEKKMGGRAGGSGTAEAQLNRRDDDHNNLGEYPAAPAEFFPLATLAGQLSQQQMQQPATRPCACAQYIGEFGSAPVERGYWFREEKVENTRARIDALCGDVYRRRREGKATEAGGGVGGKTRRKRLVIYQRNENRRLLALDDNVRVFQGLLGPEWDVVPIVHDNEHEPCWLYSQLMDADMLLTPHGFQSMLLLFLPPGATVLEVFPYKYWKEGYAPLAKEWGVRHEHIMSRPVSWEKRLALFFVPLERCMKSIHCRKWSRGADVRLEEHHLRQIAKAAEQASKRKEEFLPPPTPATQKRGRRE